MIKIYPHAPDSPMTGSPEYAKSLLRLYSQFYFSGVLEIQARKGGQVVLLIVEGSPAGAFHQEKSTYREFPLEKLTDYWPAGEAAIRSINLPREAVRTVRCALEWHPPSRPSTIDSSAIGDYLEVCRIQLASCLLQLSWPLTDGYIYLQSGKPIPSEITLASQNGVESGHEILEKMLEGFGGPCTISRYEIRPATPSYQMLLLRLGITHWVKAILSRYVQMTNSSMASQLSGAANMILRSNSLFIQIAGDTPTDTHVFTTVDAAVSAYQLFLNTLSTQMSRVIGKTLEETVFSETFDTLDLREKEVLSKYRLLN